MNLKDLGLRVAGTIFGIVSVFHLLRIITGVQVVVDNWSMPVWVNIAGFIGTGFLCVFLWVLAARRDTE